MKGLSSMESLLYLLPLVGCAAMMVVMMSGHGGHGTRGDDRRAEIPALRAEIDWRNGDREGRER